MLVGAQKQALSDSSDNIILSASPKLNDWLLIYHLILMYNHLLSLFAGLWRSCM